MGREQKYFYILQYLINANLQQKYSQAQTKKSYTII